jgi:hypothetical protein
MKSEVTFNVFQYNKNKEKRFKEITLNIKSIKNLTCGGVGCLVRYNNGKKKLILWDCGNNLEHFEYELQDGKYDEFLKAIWFDEETYDIFWEWKNYWFDECTGNKISINHKAYIRDGSFIEDI